ncbi:MAG: thioredoxin family protein [Woeseiaceae bacterium]|jgi:peroxiredoxin
MRFESLTIELDTPAPDFSLPGTDGNTYTLQDVAGENGTLIAFICNHCPFVLHIIDGFSEFAREYQDKGIGIAAISSNDAEAFPDDSPEHMVAFAKAHGFTFPYLYDESQQVAIDYKAVCTPDFFLYDREGKLAYCGQFDSSRPRTEHSKGPRTELPVNGEDLRAAADAIIAGQPVPEPQWPSNGCSMKWKAGNEPAWG